MKRSATKPIVELHDVKVHFPVTQGLLRRVIGYVKAVDGVSFSIWPGETLGLVGESGCGKTTLGRVILGLLYPTSGTVYYRSSALSTGAEEKVDLAQLEGEQLQIMRQEIAAIFQDPYSSLNPRMTVADIIGEPLRIHGMPRTQRRVRIVELLETVGLRKTCMNRYPHEFSGGQRQRIGVARALALNPKLIICDEPVSALDVSIQAQVLNLMADLQERFGFTYLFISHNLSVVQYISHRVAVMYLGKIVEITEAETLYKQPFHPYTEALLSAVPISDPDVHKQRILLEGNVPSPISPPTGCYFHPRCRYAKSYCSQELPKLRELENGHWVACHRGEELELEGLLTEGVDAV